MDHMLAEYNAYSTLFCLFSGNTLNCEGPWLYGTTWNNNTLADQIVENTNLDSGYECSSDISYLAPESARRIFYGYSTENFTASVDVIAHVVSLYAAGSCATNNTCATFYSNDTEQMYSDYRYYINSTYLSYVNTELSINDTRSYCPTGIKSTASAMSWLSDYFNAGTEYYGLHNAVFKPGVAEAINGTEQEIRVQASEYLGKNAQTVEFVLLSMVFFSYSNNGPLDKRSGSSEDEELYPGCTRKEYIANGFCEGVIPPRRWDMDGRVVPMKDRDMRMFLLLS